MLDTQLSDLGVAGAARQIAAGTISASQLVEACAERIAEREAAVKAWAHFDRESVGQRARMADEFRGTGAPVGPLHGVPVGIKDIIDVADMPGENGSPIHRGRVPVEDAMLVRRLREAGALIMGKTVTTEFAFYHPGKTTNPHDPARTPGGSSSGSAAAVACGMVPAAVGTQTNGSVIRPASFCGVYGYKPSFGRISRSGVLTQSPSLDTMGVFARSLEDAAMVAEGLSGYDADDPSTSPASRLRLLPVAGEEPPVEPMIAFVRTPVWDRASEETKAGFAEVAEALGAQCDEVDLPEVFARGWDWQGTVMATEMARWLGEHYDGARDQISDVLAELIERGRGIPAVDYLAARDMRAVLNAGLEELFERYDAVITPAAPGEAPEGLESTGDPSFCTLWTFCGNPAVSLPLLTGANGLPVGVQVVGPVGDDARLLRTARWLEQALAGDGGQGGD